MKKAVSLIIACMLTVSMIMPAMAFTDTDASLYKKEIDELSQLGIISGFDDNTFKPEDNVTRAQAAKMFAVVKGFTGKPTDYMYLSQRASFSDFNSFHWAFKYACYLMPELYYVNEEGKEVLSVRVIDGFEDGTFKPDDYVTAAQFLKMAICSFGDSGYYLEAEENGGYPDGYINTAKKYGFSDGVDISDMNEYLTREKCAKIISNTINVPIRIRVVRNDINDNHEMIQNSFIVTYDGKNTHYPLTTFKSMLIANDWGNQNAYTDISPLVEAEEFFAYAEIGSISPNEVTVNPTGIMINTDGSIYLTTETFKAANDNFELDKNTSYYMQFKKLNGIWTLTNYSMLGGE